MVFVRKIRGVLQTASLEHVPNLFGHFHLRRLISPLEGIGKYAERFSLNRPCWTPITYALKHGVQNLRIESPECLIDTGTSSVASASQNSFSQKTVFIVGLVFTSSRGTQAQTFTNSVRPNLSFNELKHLFGLLQIFGDSSNCDTYVLSMRDLVPDIHDRIDGILASIVVEKTLQCCRPVGIEAARRFKKPLRFWILNVGQSRGRVIGNRSRRSPHNVFGINLGDAIFQDACSTNAKVSRPV